MNLLLGLVVGFALGVAHFATLGWAVARYASGRAGWAVAAQGVRLAVVGGVLYALARAGAGPLLAGALGLLAGRALVLRRARA